MLSFLCLKRRLPICFGSIPSVKHLFNRQAEQHPLVCRLISQLFVLEQIKYTLCRLPCRRKNVLQDIQLITLKFIPRAVSPHTRHTNGKLQFRFVNIIFNN